MTNVRPFWWFARDGPHVGDRDRTARPRGRRVAAGGVSGLGDDERAAILVISASVVPHVGTAIGLQRPRGRREWAGGDAHAAVLVVRS